MYRMAFQARRISKSLLLLIPVLAVAMLLEPLFFSQQTHVRAWTPEAREPMHWQRGLGARPEKAWLSPEFPESPTGAMPLLLIESPPMNDKERKRREQLLHQELAKEQLGPLLLQIQDLPEAGLAQKALHLSKLPTRSAVVLEISLLDLIREDRGSWGGYQLPVMDDSSGSVVASWPKQIYADTTWPPFLLRLPYLRRLWTLPLLPTRRGSFPDSLWPLRRGGAPKESARYAKIALALRIWKQQVEAMQGHLILLYLPLPIEADAKQLATELESLSLDSKQLQSSRAGRGLGDLCKRLGIPFVDPTLLLRNSTKPKRPLFDVVDAEPFGASYTERAEHLILGRLVRQGIRPLFH